MNFHNGDLLNRLIIKNRLYGISLWSDEYLFVGSGDHSIKLINLKSGKVIKKLKGHNQEVSSIKKYFFLNMENV